MNNPYDNAMYHHVKHDKINSNFSYTPAAVESAT